MITSGTNQKLKYVRKLLSSARERRESGLFVAEGARLFAEIPAPLVEAVYISEDYKGTRPAFPGKTEIVGSRIFRELSDTISPQGILAVVRQPDWSGKIRETSAGSGNFLLLDGIRDPGNLGTMIRTCEAAGVRGVYLSPDCVDLYNPKVIRSTMGSIFRVPAVTADLVHAAQRLKDAGIAVYATSMEARKTFREVPLKGAAVVIGSEAEGISERVFAAATDCIRIPMQGRIESLNAAVSAAILLFSDEG